MFCFVMFGCCCLEACFSNERQKGSGCGKEERWGGTGRRRGKRNLNQDILYEKLSIFNIKFRLSYFMNKSCDIDF